MGLVMPPTPTKIVPQTIATVNFYPLFLWDKSRKEKVPKKKRREKGYAPLNRATVRGAPLLKKWTKQSLSLCEQSAQQIQICNFNKKRNEPKVRFFFYESIALSLANSLPLALLNISRRSSTVRFFFSSPLTSTIILPS